MTDPLDHLDAFVAELRARLEAGRHTYGDRSFNRAPASLLGELEQEALDLAGWGFVLHERIRRLREHVEAHVFARESVQVVPIVWLPHAHRFQPRPAVEMLRLPVARELIELPQGDELLGPARFDGGTFTVHMVRLTPGASTAADVFVVAADLEAAMSDLGKRLQAAEGAHGA